MKVIGGYKSFYSTISELPDKTTKQFA